MDFYLTAISLAIICKFFSFIETTSRTKNISSFPLCTRNATTKYGLCKDKVFEHISFVELSSNSVPTHVRVPRNVRDNTPRRPQYRHSTRVYTEKPAHFLLPPKGRYTIKRGNEFSTQPIKSTTGNILFKNSESVTTPVSHQVKLPFEIKLPSVILEPPLVERKTHIRVITKLRNQHYKLRNRGHKRYDRRYHFRRTNRIKVPAKNSDRYQTSSITTAPPVQSLSVIADFAISTKPYNNTLSYNNLDLLHQNTTDSSTENFDFSSTTPYTEPVGESTSPSGIIYSSQETDNTVKQFNYTTPSEPTQDYIQTSLLSHEVASMGMKVVATKKGIEMVRQAWFDVEPTTVDVGIKNQENIDELSDNVHLSVAETGDYRTKLLSDFRQHTESQNSVEHVIPGVAGVDYPNFNQPPPSKNKPCSSGFGYFADASSGCQVFYICIGNGVGEPLLCPNGTLFSQDFLVCDWWYNVDCR